MVIDLYIKEALAVHNMLGEHGALWLIDRIRTLTTAGDIVAAKRQQRIASVFSKIARLDASQRRRFFS